MCSQETLDIDLEDLEVIATLGVGGFGRVELVQVIICRTLGSDKFFNVNFQVFKVKCLDKLNLNVTFNQKPLKVDQIYFDF